MASKAQIVITVYSTRGASRISYTTKGKYVSFTTAGLTDTLTGQPVLSTASLEAFWSAVLAIVSTDVAAGG